MALTKRARIQRGAMKAMTDRTIQAQPELTLNSIHDSIDDLRARVRLDLDEWIEQGWRVRVEFAEKILEHAGALEYRAQWLYDSVRADILATWASEMKAHLGSGRTEEEVLGYMKEHTERRLLGLQDDQSSTSMFSNATAEVRREVVRKIHEWARDRLSSFAQYKSQCYEVEGAL